MVSRTCICFFKIAFLANWRYFFFVPLTVHIWAALPYFFALNGVICVCGIMFTYLAAKVEKTEMEKYNDLKPIVSEISDLNLSGRFAFVRDNRRMYV